MLYKNPSEIIYYSPRYEKWITVAKNYLSNGADVVWDFYPISWYIHDWVCGSYFGSGPKPVGGQWDDGTPMNNWQLSRVFADVIRSEAGKKIAEAEGRFARLKARAGAVILPKTRFWGTWLFGGGKARDNGMW